MSVTPRSTIRAWMRAQVESGRFDASEIVDAAIERFVDDPDVVTELVSSIVRTESQGLVTRQRAATRTPGELRQQIEEDAKDSPFAHIVPKRETDIILDMASMGRDELITVASTLEREADNTAHNAAFVRAVAARLAPGEKVRDNHTREDLLKLKGLITISIKTSAMIGQSQTIPIPERIR